MYRLIPVILVFMGLLALSVGCDTTMEPNYRLPQLIVDNPDSMVAGQVADWNFVPQFGYGPYTVSCSFGGGAIPDTGEAENTIGPEFHLEVEMVNPSANESAEYTATFTLVDALGNRAIEQVAYSVGPRVP